MKRLFPLVLLALACRPESRPATDNASFEAANAQWRKTRLERLTRPEGWLSVVALIPLREGTNEVQLPAKPPVTARMTLQNGKVTLASDPAFTVDGKPVIAPIEMHSDNEERSTVVRHGALSFFIHKVGENYGVRVKDPASENRRNFRGLQYFPPSPKYSVEARFEPYDPPKKIPFGNVSGITTEETSPGALVFTIDGKELRLDPILEQGEKDLFIVFKDATSGRETYGAARYLYAHPAGANGKTIVDFNKAYNPPCAFTPYATCPLPPPQNRLPVRIEAGEKRVAGH
jgi:uncharacterized protein (DUF1684 family)